MGEYLNIDDQQLATALQRGTPGAFKELVECFQDRVLNTCHRFLFNREDAEDIAQEVFIEVYRSIAHFKGQSKLSTWIYRIAVTRSIDFIRKSKRKKRFAPLKSLFTLHEEGKEIANDPNDTPELNLEQSERMKVLQNAIASLPESQNIVFTLSKCDGISNKNIAEIMGCSLSSVESLMHRAKKNLRKKLYHYFEKDLKRSGRFHTLLFFTWFFLFCPRLADYSFFIKIFPPQAQVFSFSDVINNEPINKQINKQINEQNRKRISEIKSEQNPLRSIKDGSNETSRFNFKRDDVQKEPLTLYITRMTKRRPMPTVIRETPVTVRGAWTPKEVRYE